MEERIKKLSLDAARWWNTHLGANSTGFVEVLEILISEELAVNNILTIKCGPNEVDHIIAKAANATKVEIDPDKQMLMIVSVVMGNMVMEKKGFVQITI